MSDARVPLSELKVDTDNLYSEDSFTDLKVATIKRLTPIQADGSPDTSRKAIFIASTTLMSAGGPLPVSAPLEVETLAEAIEKFPEAIEQGVQAMIEEAREMQRQEASRIVVPQGPVPDLTGGGGGGRGGPGGGGGIIR